MGMSAARPLNYLQPCDSLTARSPVAATVRFNTPSLYASHYNLEPRLALRSF